MAPLPFAEASGHVVFLRFECLLGPAVYIIPQIESLSLGEELAQLRENIGARGENHAPIHVVREKVKVEAG